MLSRFNGGGISASQINAPGGVAGLDANGNLSDLSLQIYSNTAANLATTVGGVGELMYATDTKHVFVNDGSTPGGTSVGVPYNPTSGMQLGLQWELDDSNAGPNGDGIIPILTWGNDENGDMRGAPFTLYWDCLKQALIFGDTFYDGSDAYHIFTVGGLITNYIGSSDGSPLTIQRWIPSTSASPITSGGNANITATFQIVEVSGASPSATILMLGTHSNVGNDAPPGAGEEFTLLFINSVSSLTWTATGCTFVNAPASVTAGQVVKFVYYNLKYYRI